MRPILLKGHERSITRVRFNRQGDLIFTCSKDNKPCVWYADTGERLGTYKGHTGSVWCMDISFDSTMLLTGSADMSARLFDVETGQQLVVFKHQTPVRDVAFGIGDRVLATASDAVMGRIGCIYIYELAADPYQQKDEPRLEIKLDSKCTNLLFGPLNKTLVTTHDDGTVRIYDTTSGEMVKKVQVHSKTINSLQQDKEGQFVVTASADFTAKLLDARTLEELKTYQTEKPVNDAAISPLFPHILLGGGQEAMVVTQTHTRTGAFEARFFHMIYAEELGVVKGHFGPIHTLHFNPNGKGYASGAEDGYVRIHHFDESYYELARKDAKEDDAAAKIQESSSSSSSSSSAAAAAAAPAKA